MSQRLDTGEQLKNTALWITLSWDNNSENIWPIGSTHHLWIGDSATVFGGLQLVPCLDFNAGLITAEEMTIPLNQIENLEVPQTITVGPHWLPLIQVCEIFIWYGGQSLNALNWPTGFHDAKSLALAGQWGETHDHTTSIRLHSSKVLGKRVRLEQRVTLSAENTYHIDIYRDRQLMLWSDLLSSTDGDAFLETLVRETQVNLLSR